MAKNRTKQEVRNWLNSQVGKRVRDKSDARLDGQCVALIKALFEYLGVKNPYAARGNARDAGDTYLREGIAKPGRGWLTIVVNHSMAAPWGHIWIDLKNEANFEQNGARALSTTKGTRPYSQRQQIMNLDHLLAPDKPKRINRSGTAKVTYPHGMNVRESYSPNSKIVASYKPGQTFKYDSYIDANGYRWLSYIAFSGKRRYVAQRKGKTNYVSGGVN